MLEVARKSVSHPLLLWLAICQLAPLSVQASEDASQSSTPPLRGLIPSPQKIATPDKSPKTGNSVESFFQLPPAPAAASSFHTQTVHGTREAKKASAGRALWHLMDNIGIPLPAGKQEEALDPTIRRGYVNPPLPEIDTAKAPKRKHEIVIESPAVQSTRPPLPPASTRAAEVAIQRKIPESELEGVDIAVPGKADEKK